MRTTKLSFLFILALSGLTEAQNTGLFEFREFQKADDLKKIISPVLILSCDRDVIKEEHTLFIYRNIPKTNLCIFPGETHWIIQRLLNFFLSFIREMK